MKYITSALVLLALVGNQDQVNAIRIKASFTDDLVKSLAEEMQKDAEGPAEEEKAAAPAAPAPAKPAPQAAAQKKAAPAPAAHNNSNHTAPHPAVAQKKAVITKKKEEEDIPMDAAAIKAYSSVIADAAEDSEP